MRSWQTRTVLLLCTLQSSADFWFRCSFWAHCNVTLPGTPGHQQARMALTSPGALSPALPLLLLTGFPGPGLGLAVPGAVDGPCDRHLAVPAVLRPHGMVPHHWGHDLHRALLLGSSQASLLPDTSCLFKLLTNANAWLLVIFIDIDLVMKCNLSTQLWILFWKVYKR